MNRFVLGLCSFLFVAAGSGIVLAANPCVSTLSDTFHLSAPAMKIGPGEYRVEFDFSLSGPDAAAGAWFFVTDAGVSQVETCSNPARAIVADGSLRLRFPVLVVAGTELWVELEYVPSTDGKLWFRLTSSVGLLPNRVFVTSVMGSGNLGSWADAAGATGLAAADAICQTRASEAGLNGTFVAWLSDGATDAYCRLQGFGGTIGDNCEQAEMPGAAGPWVRTDGFPFGGFDPGNTYATVLAPPRCDESGECPDSPSGERRIFTGTNNAGSVSHLNQPCDNWTNGTEGFATGGITSGTASNWTNAGSNACFQTYPLLCFQTGSGPQLPPFSVTGKIAFLSSQRGSGNVSTWSGSEGNTGIAAGDAVCRRLAADAGLANAGRFRAWLSDNQEQAAQRISSDGPWVRLDGVPLAESRNDLLDGSLFAPLNLTETGAYIGHYFVWTGTRSDGSREGSTCQGWTVDNSGEQGGGGSASLAGQMWTEFTENPCDFTASHIYCFED